MADSSKHEKTNDIDSPISPSSKPPGQKNTVEATPVRRVCFSELPPKHKMKQRKKMKDGHSNCCLCCAWTCMVIFAIFLALLVVGALFVAFLRSELPEIRLQKMSFNKLDAAPSSSSSPQKTLLSADTDLFMEVSNTNQKVGLSYGAMTVNVRSEKIGLGQTEVVGFSQEPKNVKVIKVHTSVTKSEVEKEIAELLKTNFKSKEVVLDVVIYAKMGFNVGGLKMNGFPIMVECMKMEQSMVDLGHGPKCSFKLLVSRTLMNAMGGGY